MTVERIISRRGVVCGGGAAVAVVSNFSAARAWGQALSRSDATFGRGSYVNGQMFGLQPSTVKDQSHALQAAIDQTAAKGLTLSLTAGTYLVAGIVLRPGVRIEGQAGATVLGYAGGGTFVTAAGAHGARLSGLVFDGQQLPLERARVSGLLQIAEATDLVIDDCMVRRSIADGIVLQRCAGRVTRTTVSMVKGSAIFSLDADVTAGAIEIANCRIQDAADNGILIWRSRDGVDGSRVTASTIERISNVSGGSGQYGNGVNVYRAHGVSVMQCRIFDCSYSAVRGNAASNFQVLGNQAAGIGEVALYAEFGFQGAMIANNIVDGAACGIAVTNFDVGGRLAVVQGNLIRNLVRREAEPVDKRGEGIAVEADAAVSGNVIEAAPTAGLLIGWGKHMRNVVAMGNLIRNARIGIAVTATVGAGQCLVGQNIISGARDGAIRAMEHAVPVGDELAGMARYRHIVLEGNVVS
ncbi:MAG: TIGR03808 family TAT-translocated repetitive protein [Hyphomicrobiaceae bacterium]|nr:TIGR03808 family TAT-translocated repetitive protein [Hyphomicrobiaceae bacterium]